MDYKEKVIALLKSQELSKEQKEKLEIIFPELKESEDERIRKFLIEDIKDTLSSEDFKHYNTEHTKKLEEALAWLEKQGEQKPIDKIKLGKKYKCIASPRYTMFMVGEIYKPEDEFLCSLMNLCSDCFESVEDGEQKPIDKVKPKFKIGDIIRFKGNETLKGEAETHKIVGYDNELYVFADGTTDLFCEQDLYELVEQKPSDKVEQKQVIDYPDNLPKDNWELIHEFVEKFGRI